MAVGRGVCCDLILTGVIECSYCKEPVHGAHIRKHRDAHKLDVKIKLAALRGASIRSASA